MSPAAPTALVVGGGIGGLTAAVALGRTGRQVTVLERAPEFGEVGAGIVLMANAMRALDALGLGDEIRAGGLPRMPGGIRTSSGRWLARLDHGSQERELGTTAVVVHRAELHRILRSGLSGQQLVTGAEATAVVPGGPDRRAVVEYVRDGRTTQLDADLVVAADGIRSRVRAQLWPGCAEPTYTGSTAWRGVTRSVFPSDTAMSQSWGHGEEFGIVPLTDGRVYWFAAAPAPPGQREPDELAAVVRRFGDWHEPIPALLADTAPESVLRHDIDELAAPLPTYVHGRVAMLGDAAHAMSPNLGQGGAQAIEDGVVLAAACGAEPDLPSALARYDRERRPRTQQIARTARRIARVGQQLTHPGAVAVRNTAIALTPAPLALRAMARFAQWDPPVIETDRALRPDR